VQDGARQRQHRRVQPHHQAASTIRLRLLQPCPVYGLKGQYDRAIDDLDRAIRLMPKNADFYTERCFAYDSKHDEARAIADCAEATKLDPRKAVTYGQRAETGAGPSDPS
jgi:tetratricopeptide (TPR) repeat protein